jgi:hypothetical protein
MEYDYNWKEYIELVVLAVTLVSRRYLTLNKPDKEFSVLASHKSWYYPLHILLLHGHDLVFWGLSTNISATTDVLVVSSWISQ